MINILFLLITNQTKQVVLMLIDNLSMIRYGWVESIDKYR